jgi:filamentous hemagglutinin
VSRAIGFGPGDEALLEREIREGLRTQPARRGKADEWGERWTVVVPVAGPNGTAAPITTGWIFEPGSEVPRSTTIFGSRKLWRRWEREGRL